jgi:hypothetical protein
MSPTDFASENHAQGAITEDCLQYVGQQNHQKRLRLRRSTMNQGLRSAR